MLSWNTGGPAIIFDRFQEAGSTTIGHGDSTPLTRKVLGLGMSNHLDVLRMYDDLVTNSSTVI